MLIAACAGIVCVRPVRLGFIVETPVIKKLQPNGVAASEPLSVIVRVRVLQFMEVLARRSKISGLYCCIEISFD